MLTWLYLIKFWKIIPYVRRLLGTVARLDATNCQKPLMIKLVCPTQHGSMKTITSLPLFPTQGFGLLVGTIHPPNTGQNNNLHSKCH